MRSLGANNSAALAAARDKGLIPIRTLWIVCKNRATGSPQSFGLWTSDDDVSIDVISGSTGSVVTRNYSGGVNLKIGGMPRVSDFTIQEVEVAFSSIAPICRSIVREYDPRLAYVEIHSGWLDTTSRIMVDPGEIDFIGLVDGAPIETPAIGGGESLFKLRVVSEALTMLTRTNTTKRSYEGQARRSNDQMAKYANSVDTWKVFWGEQEVGTVSSTQSPYSG